PQHVGLTVPYHTIDYVVDNLPVCVLADRPIKRWQAVIKGGEDFLPRWIITLVLLPLMALETTTKKFFERASNVLRQHTQELTFLFDMYNVAEFKNVAANFGLERYGYAVTPNAEHIIRLHDDATFRASYAAAKYILLDSQFLSHLLRITKGIRLPVCTGSDLTATLFSDVIKPDDPLVLIGGSAEQAQLLRARYGLIRMAHLNPKMGFIHDPEALETCLRFIEDHSPFRFCLLAVGAPQQEAVAQQLKARGIARGLALCIGASINFLTGNERRAPLWMQRCGMEWSFRLIQAPRRMAKRYLVRGPRVFEVLYHAKIILRGKSTTALRLVSATNRQSLPTASSAEPALYVNTERKSRSISMPN
ncbi:MAG: WecB/TagA/CpsF family glycosyltransferase, partial [Sulfuricaulis sp.]